MVRLMSDEAEDDKGETARRRPWWLDPKVEEA
jgi:hypothetical protein